MKITDIESDRMMIRVDDGKGGKDRYTVLSPRLLTELRAYVRRYRPEEWLFPGMIPGRHLTDSAAQRAYDKARHRAGVVRGSGIHTLRHCFATHLLEAGVDVRVLQVLMGHRSILTTQRYAQVTRKTLGSTQSPLDLLPAPSALPDPPTKPPTDF